MKFYTRVKQERPVINKILESYTLQTAGKSRISLIIRYAGYDEIEESAVCYPLCIRLLPSVKAGHMPQAVSEPSSMLSLSKSQ